MVFIARMKFASEARPSQYIVPFGNTEPTCMPLSGHFMNIEGWVIVVVVVVVLLFYVHRKHLRSCRDGQLT